MVFLIAFSPDGHTIAAGGRSLDVQLWNADTGTLIRTILVGTSTVAGVTGVAFSPDGHRVATGRSDGALQLWDPDTGAQLGSTLIGHTGPVARLAFRPDGRQIATVSTDGTLRLWSATVGQPMRGPDPLVAQVAFSPDGHRVAASGNIAVQRWDVDSGQPLPPMTAGWFGYVDGGRIVTTTGDGTVQVWDAGTGQPASPPVHIDIRSGFFGLFRFAFSGDGRTVGSLLRRGDGTVQLWEVATGRGVGQPMTVEAPDDSGYAVAFSPDGHRLVAGYDDGLRLWNADTTQPDGTGMTDPGSTGVNAVAFSRDGTTVAAGLAGGAVQLWDLSTRQQLPNSPLQGHTSTVMGVAFGPDHQLATGGVDATLRLWDTATGKPTAAPLTMSDTVTSVAVSPDGRLVASASLDGTVLLSPAVADPAQLCDKLPANMSRKQWRDWVSPSIPYITVCPLPIAPD